MTTKYTVIFEKNGQKVYDTIQANSDAEARQIVQKKLRSESTEKNGTIFSGVGYGTLGNGSKREISLGGLGWKVSSLVEEGEDYSVWNETQSGGHKRLTKEKVVVNKKEKTVYVGPRGGRYVRANGKFVRV